MKLEKLLLQIKEDIDELRKTPFKLFIRANGLEPVGILTKRKLKYDPGWGTMRTWAVGLTFGDGKKFEEPLDRKNKRTGELENLIQIENDVLVVTARKTSDPDDDNDDNFQYLLNPHVSNKMKDAMDRIRERDRIIQDMEKKIAEIEQSRDFYQREAEASGSEIRMLKARIANLSEKIANSEQQAEHYRTLLKKTQVVSLEEEGYLDEKMTGARARGGFTAKDSADVILEAAKKQKNAQVHLSNIGMGSMSPEFATKSDLANMESKIMKAIELLTKEEKKETPRRPPLKEE